MNESPDQTKPRSDANYLLIVGGLMLIIIVLLAVLWQKERSRRLAAEDNLAQEIGKRQQIMQMMVSDIGKMSAQSSNVIPRKILVPEKIKFDGQEKLLFRIPADAGRDIGLEVGDVLMIMPDQPKTQTLPATTGPAANPASQPGPTPLP